MRKIYAFLMSVMLACVGCEWHLSSSNGELEENVIVERYDRIQSLYLTTGDFSALQQMNTGYPQQTRTLIEDVLKIGRVNEPEINIKLLNFYQDTTLQTLIASAEQEFANMDDINEELNDAFERLKQMLGDIEIPQIYAQIGSLDQSITVGNGILGISLDKYLGRDYPLYHREDYGYSESQLSVMTREYIVPDCIGFYLLSIYPMPQRNLSQLDRDMHIGKIQWVVNNAVGHIVFNNTLVNRVDEYMKRNKNVTTAGLLANNEYQLFQ